MVAHCSEVIVIGLSVVFLACIIGYNVVWAVTPALLSPLMVIENQKVEAMIFDKGDLILMTDNENYGATYLRIKEAFNE